jgi:hypothetical protein
MNRSIRSKCLKKGHRIRSYGDVPMPFEFCVRLHCDYSQVSLTYPMSSERRKAFAEASDRANTRSAERVVNVFSWWGF